MAASIDYYLKNLSYNSYYLKSSYSETEKIRKSIANLLSRLDYDLGFRINRRFIFGSYDRGTILPRSIDSKSDVDIMVVFNHTEYERTPETYRTWLRNFANKHYKNRYGSEVIKSFPTVTIKLNNIHYDLVPAKEENNWFSGTTLFIPDKEYSWQSTDPSDVSSGLTSANQRYNNIVKPIVRILKAWNCNNGYPYGSYELELAVTAMNFSGDNIESGFFYAAERLPTLWSDSQYKKSKLASLKYNLDKVKECLESYNTDRAKHWLHRILPC